MRVPVRQIMFVPLLTVSVATGAAPPAGGPPAPGRTFDVTVVNEPGDPVPVTGTVDATVSGSVNAVVTNTPDVSVVSSPSTPVFVSEADARMREILSLRLEKTSAGIGVDFTVPSDRVLVIESINVSAQMADELDADTATLRIRPPGTDGINAPGILFIPIRLEPAGRIGTVVFPVSGSTDFRRGVASLTTRLYAGPDHDLLFSIPSPTGVGTEAAGVISVSGYLVPADSPELSP